MRKIPFPQIVGPTYTLASLNAECQRCVNLQVEDVESGQGENVQYLRETPGLIEFYNAHTNPLPYVSDAFPDADNIEFSLYVQAMYKAANGRVFFIMRDTLYELFADSSVTVRGILLPNTSTSIQHKWRISENALALFVIVDYVGFPAMGVDFHSGLASYNFETHSFRNVNFDRPGFLGTKFIGFMDQYLITLVINTTATFNNPNNKLSTQFQISPINVDPDAAWDALDVFSVESSPDNLVGMAVNGRELWMFGPESYEVFYNSENPAIRFTRINQAAYPIGCIAGDSILAFQDRVFWLGGSKEGFGIVWMSEGYQAVRVSTTAIEKIIKDFAVKEDAIAWTYQVPGHAKYVLTFPTEQRTLCYDLLTNSWNELEYRDPDTQEVMQHRGICSIFAFGKNLVGDFARGIIYELSENTYTDNGAPIVRFRRAPVATRGKTKTWFHLFSLNMEVGVGLVNNPIATEPLISMRFSDDNAKTWKNYYTKSIGRAGEYSKPVDFDRLGCTDQGRVFEIYTNEPVPIRIISAELGISQGVH